MSARKFLNAIDLNKNELQNAVVQNLASAPSSPSAGQEYYDTTLNQFGYWNGTAWVYSTGLTYGSAGASAVGDTAAGGSATSVSRSDHRHAREAFATPGSSAVGDSAAAGTATTVPHSDHVHAREAFAAPTAETTFGTSSATGSATTLPHSDHTHGNPTHVDADHSGIHLNALAAPTADVSLNSHKVTNLLDPTAVQDAATKNYVDGLVQGATAKPSAFYATTTTLPANTYANGTAGVGATLTGNSNGALATIDGQTPVAADIVLVKNEAAPANNGLYTVTQLGDGSHPYILTRHIDMDTTGEIRGAYVYVIAGTTNATQGWIVTGAGPWTVGTTAINWTQFTGVGDITAGAGLTKSGNTLAVQPGNGILADGSSTRVDPAVVARKFAASVGDGASTSIVVTHNLNTLDVIVQLYDNSSPNSQLETDVQHTSVNTITLVFALAPTTNQYRCVVLG